LTADGLDDIVCTGLQGNAYLSVNQGDGNRAAAKPPTFKRVSATALIKTNEGYAQDRVILADINGDGRGDDGIIDDTGNVHFWRNGWIDPIPQYWQPLGLRFTAKGMGYIRGVRFEDINGDVSFGIESSVIVPQANARCRAVTIGFGSVKKVPLPHGPIRDVAWLEGFLKGESSGPTHKGMAIYQTDKEKNIRNRIHFARIFGHKAHFGGVPSQDYVSLQHKALSSGWHRMTTRVWKNIGAGGSKPVADGSKYCNMMGHKDGPVDYVWAWSTGKMELFANQGKKPITDSDGASFWDPAPGVIWNPPRNLDRRDLHLVD
jgi:hypothetical protein